MGSERDVSPKWNTRLSAEEIIARVNADIKRDQRILDIMITIYAVACVVGVVGLCIAMFAQSST